VPQTMPCKKSRFAAFACTCYQPILTGPHQQELREYHKAVNRNGWRQAGKWWREMLNPYRLPLNVWHPSHAASDSITHPRTHLLSSENQANIS